ncbi:alpha/beta hydrolase family protein [Bordetella genomosp. 13]|uniref:alpha/beta hydrolase family protein n=1 Tax=Bordetella genomosp. 13 TaxID=463040 RepID=UPI0016430FF7|nr:lipase family protein [Bordetella genomosp. 13]
MSIVCPKFRGSSGLSFAVLLLLGAPFSGLAQVLPQTHSQARTAPRGDLLQTRPVTEYTRAAIDRANRGAAPGGQAACDVQVVEATYRSIGVRGEPEDLSAALYLPRRCKPAPHDAAAGDSARTPLLASAPGTQSKRRVRASQAAASDPVLSTFAAHGYAVVVPDYLGLGGSTYPYHPYLHADSEASAVVDAILAAREFMRARKPDWSGLTLLMGYSQGGHAAMAAQREIERHYLDRIPLAAAAPMAGPYALQQTFLQAWAGLTNGQPNVLAPQLLAYTMISYQHVYGDIYRSPRDVFKEPYAQRIEAWYPGDQTLGALRARFPADGGMDTLRQPAFTADFRDNPANALRRRLAANDLLDWTPHVATALCGSSQDTIVAYANSRAAYAAFRQRGAPVQLLDVADAVPPGAPGASHHTTYGAPLCYARVKAQVFDPLVDADARRRARPPLHL